MAWKWKPRGGGQQCLERRRSGPRPAWTCNSVDETVVGESRGMGPTRTLAVSIADYNRITGPRQFNIPPA